MTAAEVEHAALARGSAAFGVLGSTADAALDGDGEPSVRVKVLTGLATPTAEERSHHEFRANERNGHLCRSVPAGQPQTAMGPRNLGGQGAQHGRILTRWSQEGDSGTPRAT